MLGALRAGRGSALIIRGEPGIGRTTLLDAFAERARDRVTVVRACGAETEVELPFSVLGDLLRPLLGELEILPQPQAAALMSALALGPPAPGDRLAVCVAALGMFEAAARRRPVLVVVDDMQWVDAASRECVEYVARRAGHALAVVLATREPGDVAVRARLPELVLPPLEDDAAALLLHRHARDLAPSVAAAIAEAAAGNPLALVELPATLSAEKRAGAAALDRPLVPGQRLQYAFGGRIRALTPRGRRALLIAAAHAEGDLTVIAAACSHARTDVAHLAEAEASGLLRIGAAHVTFGHPLIRSAVYRDAPPTARRAAHTALAAALRDDRRVWHLAVAAIGPDERVATKLERVGHQAAARRAYTAACDALERAARLGRSENAVSRRLLAAGQAAAAAGLPDRALALMREAAEATRDGGARARAEHLRGRMLIWRGRGAEATALLVAQAGACEAADPTLAASMLADAATGATTTNSYLEAERLAQHAVELLGDAGDPPTRAAVLTTLGWVLTLRGKVRRARPVVDAATRLCVGLDELGPHWPWLHLLLRTRIPLGELEAALSQSEVLRRRARRAGALAVLSGAQLVAADAAFRLGYWDRAEVDTLEAIRLADEAGQPPIKGFALTTRARLLAARGADGESRAAAASALELAESEGISAGLRFAHAAIGFLELGFNRVDAAIAELEIVERVLRGSGLEEPTVVPWLPDLIEAHIRSGRPDDARRSLTTLARQAGMTGSAVAAAAEARCRGLLDEDFDSTFGTALALHEQRPMPFERARTVLAYGRRLHRARRRTEARERLREALVGFERLRAGAWARQARDELRVAGARRRRAPAGDALTRQEQRVVAAVRRGASNREIAADMFLSPRTVEFHLRQIYRKLNVHSRTQLCATLASDRDTPTETR